MQTIFAFDFEPQTNTKSFCTVPLLIEARISEENLTENDVLYVQKLVGDIILNKDTIDNYISKFSIDWDIERLGKVDKSILRMAIGEILFENATPIEVIINEAIKIAKKYGTSDSHKFINGILGTFVKSRQLSMPFSAGSGL